VEKEGSPWCLKEREERREKREESVIVIYSPNGSSFIYCLLGVSGCRCRGG